MMRSRQLMGIALAGLLMAGCSSELTGLGEQKQSRALGTSAEVTRDEGVEPNSPINKCAVYRNELCEIH